MDTRALADRADALLARAGTARADGHGSRCLQFLQQAADLVAPSELDPLKHRIAWRIAKAGFDFDDPAAMLDGLEPLLDAGEPFAHVPAGRRALSAIADRWWDTCGYRDDRVLRLWQALAQVHRAEGDPWMAAQARSKMAWHLACSGDHAGLDAIIEETLASDPKRFGDGPHRHPQAPDTPSSVWWAQLEVVRTGLWAAVWSRRRDRARDLVDNLLDAAEAAGLHVQDDVWWLDPLCRAGIAFELPELVDEWGALWVDGLAEREDPRSHFHHALARGLLASFQQRPEHAVQAMERAIELADAQTIGAEWPADARLELARIHPDPQRRAALRAQATELAERFGLAWVSEIVTPA